MNEKNESRENPQILFDLINLFQEAKQEGQDLPLLKEEIVKGLRQKYSPYMDTICATKGISQFDRDDIFSEVFLAIMKSLHTITGRTEGELKNWIKTTTRRKISWWRKKNQKENPGGTLPEDLPGEEKLDLEGSENRALFLQWLWENFFEQNLLGIKEETREMFIQHYINKKTYKEIAEEKGIKASCVRKRAFDGRKALKRAFQKQFPGEEGRDLFNDLFR